MDNRILHLMVRLMAAVLLPGIGVSACAPASSGQSSPPMPAVAAPSPSPEQGEVVPTSPLVSPLDAPEQGQVGAAASIRVPSDFATVQAAIDAASPGDTILVAPGLYVGSIVLNKGVILQAETYDAADPRNNPTILDGDGQSAVITIPEDVTPEPQIVGFRIQNASDDGISPESPFVAAYNYFTDADDLIDYERGSGGVTRNNVFENAGDDALDLDSQINDLLIEGNTLLNSRQDGIEIRLQDNRQLETRTQVTIIIRNNRIEGSGHDGIQLIDYNAEGLSTEKRVFYIERNLFLNNGRAAIGMMDNEETNEDFRAASVKERVYVFNNTFIGHDHGISGGDNVVALNNIFANTVNYALKNVDGNSVVDFSLFWRNGIHHSGSQVGANIILDQDPLLTPQFTLGAGSPAINRGTAYFEHLGSVVLNYPAEAYQGPAPDLGAYEFLDSNGAVPITDHQVFVPLMPR